ncbi:phosphodiesterase [Deinococcus deserti]|uniref:Putative Metallophosphoesterase putative cAMP phosphodiesterase n=1 Tax=Deinococcus deserti (strain DSM 17065 / CIP 109153 / LMG 22923 / VCD115) TaxID=546414 RepID=C1CX57_DEIDV|nr:putative Metallophosphoesterase; putative cAMP phosphodiesterase [Deinococcus deserti VCD115]
MLIAQLSDPHVMAEPDDQAAHALRRAVSHLLELPVLPDLVLITGDCTEHGEVAEYETFRTLIQPLPMPVYVVPGNHDQRAAMLSALGRPGTLGLEGFMQYVVEAGPLRLIGLDTHLPGQDAGELCAARLDWLEDRLTEAPGRPCVIFMHHPPARSSLNVMDGIGLRDPQAFEALLARHSNVERVLTGHLHMAMTRRCGGTLLMTAPGTQHTWLPDLGHPERLSVQLQAPACLLHSWTPDAGLVSFTSVIADRTSPMLDLHDGTAWRS